MTAQTKRFSSILQRDFHEQKIWERFLKSARDEAAAQLWLSDGYSGEA